MSRESKYIPKGGMCGACLLKDKNCSGLPFHEFPVIRVYPDGVRVVKCREFERGARMNE